MPAIKSKCEFCGKRYWASRKDSRFCKELCRCANKRENSKFQVSDIPKSGVPGVTFNRFISRWEVRIKMQYDTRRKYVGAFKQLAEAIAFQNELESSPPGPSDPKLCTTISGAH